MKKIQRNFQSKPQGAELSKRPAAADRSCDAPVDA
jgi:hypothetical protein